ncbi:MAG: B12-binding domain-containing radical SAM protein [Elusimicrobia bacterium]|nr:B12-binding domain-containing radical SAM protein [Elusimicrobiota bacterium]
MKIALVICPFWGIYSPPYVLAYLAALLRKEGHEVSVHDISIELYLKSGTKYKNFWKTDFLYADRSFYKRFMHDHRALIEKSAGDILAGGPDIVGISVYDTTKYISLELASVIKAKNTRPKIVLGGPSCSRSKDGLNLVRHRAVDIVVPGEGDRVFPEIAGTLEKTGTVGFCSGTLLKKNGEVIDCEDAPPVRSLDGLPFPDYVGFDHGLYRDARMGEHALHLIFSRGCVRNCVFCDIRSLHGGRYRRMNASRMFEEIRHHRNIFPDISSFHFNDSSFNADINNMVSFCDLVMEKRLELLGDIDKESLVRGISDITWVSHLMIRPQMSRDILGKMKKAGCRTIIYGFESGSERILRLMEKGHTLEEAQDVLRRTHDAGIQTGGFFMFGFPGEDRAEFGKTLGFLKRNSGYLDFACPSLTFSSLINGTRLRDSMEEFDIDTADGAHMMYWQSKDGSNNYMERFSRFVEFCDFAESSGIKILPDFLLDIKSYRDLYFARYFRYRKDSTRALGFYRKFLDSGAPPHLKELAEDEVSEYRMNRSA